MAEQISNATSAATTISAAPALTLGKIDRCRAGESARGCHDDTAEVNQKVVVFMRKTRAEGTAVLDAGHASKI